MRYNKNTVGTTEIYACGDGGYEVVEARSPRLFRGWVVHRTNEKNDGLKITIEIFKISDENA